MAARSARNTSELFHRVGHGVGDAVEVFIAVECGDGGADQVFARRNGGGDGHDGEDIFFEKSLPETVGAFLGSEDDGNGWCFAAPRIEAEIVKEVAVAFRVFQQAFVVLRFALDDVEGGRSTSGLRRAEGGTEDGVLRVSAEILDEVPGAGDETARAGEGLRHAGAKDIDLGVETEVIDRATTLAAEDTKAVGIVEDGETAEVFHGGEEFGDPGDVPFHRIHAFEHEHLWGVGGKGGGDLAEILDAVMGEPFDGGVRQPDAVPKAGVKVFVREDDVAFLGEAGDAGHARQITCGVDVAGFTTEEGGEFFFELDMVGAGAVGGAGAGGAGAPFEHGGTAGLDDLWVEGKAKVVVAREHDHVAAVVSDVGTLLCVDGPIVGGVLESHLRGVVVAAAREDGLGAFREEGERHG